MSNQGRFPSIVLGLIHGSYVHERRVRVLGSLIAEMLPAGASVLDVGCGDGRLSGQILAQRSDVTIEGLDVLPRANARISATHFDGKVIPCEDSSVDSVMFVDVLHHAEDPCALLREGARVARNRVIVKDHNCGSPLAELTLGFMDWVGNARYDVNLPYNYWSAGLWTAAFDLLGLQKVAHRTELGLYPGFADWVFGRNLHFLACLEKQPATTSTSTSPTTSAPGAH